MTLLNKGLIYFNEENLDQSILCLKEVVEEYPRTASFSSAKIGLKDTYLQKGSIDEYLLYINKIPQLDISVSEKDSLSYQVFTIDLIKKSIMTLKFNLKVIWKTSEIHQFFINNHYIIMGNLVGKQKIH